MAKYRKKPVVVEAEQFDPTVHPWPAGVIADLAGAMETARGEPRPVKPGLWLPVARA